MSLTLTEVIAEYILQRKQNKLEPLQKARDKALAATDDPVIQATILMDYDTDAVLIEQQFTPSHWLTEKAKNAAKVSLASHVAKYTHSDSKASSLLMSNRQPTNHYLITTKLTDPKLDFFVSSAAFLDIAALLRLTAQNQSLITQLKQNSIAALEPFSADHKLREQWKSGFLAVLGSRRPAAHTLSKQIYFPIKEGNGRFSYHLLCPLFSSSLAHALYDSVNATRFGDSKEIREARNSGIYHPKRYQSFPATAVQHFGGSQPQNVSLLNSERYGQSYLLNCAPPNYQRQPKAPIKMKTIFNRSFSSNVSALTQDFRHFLEQNRRQNNFEIRYKRDYAFLLPIIEQLLNYVAEIQNSVVEAGWSEQANYLKKEHKLWLDRNNNDVIFQTERDKGEWLLVIAEDFASWLIKQLKSDKYRLSDIERRYIKKVCLLELKKFEWQLFKPQENSI